MQEQTPIMGTSLIIEQAGIFDLRSRMSQSTKFSLYWAATRTSSNKIRDCSSVCRVQP